jgi:hypothetical protein
MATEVAGEEVLSTEATRAAATDQPSKSPNHSLVSIYPTPILRPHPSRVQCPPDQLYRGTIFYLKSYDRN